MSWMPGVASLKREGHATVFVGGLVVLEVVERAVGVHIDARARNRHTADADDLDRVGLLTCGGGGLVVPRGRGGGASGRTGGVPEAAAKRGECEDNQQKKGGHPCHFLHNKKQTKEI